jgi:nitric oxide reductase large subunit
VWRFLGFEAWENLQLLRRQPWVQKYRWPIYFFVSVAFWNLVGAGLYARSPEFLQTDVIEAFRSLRVIGNTVFAAATIALAAFVIGLRTGGSTRNERFRVPAGEPLAA